MNLITVPDKDQARLCKSRTYLARGFNPGKIEPFMPALCKSATYLVLCITIGSKCREGRIQ